MLCKPLEVFSSLVGRFVHVVQKKMPGKLIPDHQKDNVQLNLLSWYIQLYILSVGEQQYTYARLNVTKKMQSTNLKKKKKGDITSVFSPLHSLLRITMKQSSKKPVLCEGNLIILKSYWNFLNISFKWMWT